MSMEYQKLPPEFYLRDTETVARELLGKLLVTQSAGGVCAGRIVETEGYLGPRDKAAHSYKASPFGRTNVMYEPGGKAYVYLIYGMYYCMNVVTREQGVPEAVLIRALEPVEGIKRMTARRQASLRKKPGEEGVRPIPRNNLLNGPGKLCLGLGIDKTLYGEKLWGERIFIAQGEPVPDQDVGITPRINIDYAEEAKDFLLRYVVKNSPCLSVKWKP